MCRSRLLALALAGTFLGVPAASEASPPGRTRSVLFQYQSASARRVELLGDFNHWRPEPMRRGAHGLWVRVKNLPDRATYRYAFSVDGWVVPDPRNRRRERLGLLEYSILSLGVATGNARTGHEVGPRSQEAVAALRTTQTPLVSLRTSYSA